MEPNIMDQLHTLAEVDGVVVTQKRAFTENGFKASYKVEDFQTRTLMKDDMAKIYDLNRLCKDCRQKIYWRKLHQKYSLEHGARLCDICEKQLEPQPVESGFGLNALRWWYGNSGQRAIHLQDNQGKELLHIVASQQTFMHDWSSQFSRVVVNTSGEYLGEVNEQHGLLGPKGNFIVADTTGPVIQIRNVKSLLPWGNKVYYKIRRLDSIEDIGEIVLTSKSSFDEIYMCKYRVTFPMEMDVQNKALLIGATILLDFKTA